MSKVTYPIYKVSDRIVFNANGIYTLLDTGFPMSVRTQMFLYQGVHEK